MDMAKFPLHNVLTARARLGEGPIWDDRHGLLYWVDIYNHWVHQFNPDTGEDVRMDVGDVVGAIALTDTHHLLLAQRHQLAELDLGSGTVTPLLPIEQDLPNNRFNDGKCDAAGRFWFGSMSSDEQAGSLYCYDGAGQLTQRETQLTISNGLGWSPDNGTFYLTDSPKQIIYAYDFDLASGSLGHRRVLIDLTDETFFPDGLTVDQDGCLWSAMWDGGCVIRFDPNGQEMARLPMPVQRPTSCTFGGSALSQLYITTAAVGLSEHEIQENLYAGDLFCVDTDTAGLPSPRFSRSAAH